MGLIRVLVLVHAARAEEHVAGGLVHAKYVIHVVCTLCKVAYKGTIGIVQVKVGPSVTLAPPNELAAALDEEGVADLYVGVAALLGHHVGGIGVYAYIAKILTLEVTASPDHVEALVVSQPAVAVEVFVLGFGGLAGRENVCILVFEGVPGHFVGLSGRHLEYIQGSIGTGLAGHLVLVGLQLRARGLD